MVTRAGRGVAEKLETTLIAAACASGQQQYDEMKTSTRTT
jgi:hypothetical protein